MHSTIAKPTVLLVGGPDVDARLELMHCLSGTFNVGALGSLPSLGDKFLAEGFDYRSYYLTRQANPFSDLLTVCQLVAIFRRLKPQVVHAFDTKAGVWGCLSARLAGVPIVVGTVTGLGSLYGNDKLATRLVRKVYQTLQKTACQLSDLTVFQNYDDAYHFIATGLVPAQKTQIILGSGVSTGVYAPGRVSDKERDQLRRELGIQPGEIVVTMISRVMRSKGVFELMDAARHVRADFPCVRFLLIGPHDDESMDRLEAEELIQLKETVIWPGPRRDIPVVLAISDIFALPSAYREGIPRVLLEAASMGLPIITTDSPGCREVVEDGVSGLLIPVRDPVALTNAIVRLIEQPDLRQRFGQASRQRAVKRFDLSVVAEQTGSMYWELLARKRLLPAIA